MSSSLSLRRYLLARLLWPVLPIVVAGMAVHWACQRRLLVSQFDESLEDRAAILATLVTRNGERFEFEFADELMPQYSREVDPSFFQIYDLEGRSLERSYSLHGEDLPFRAGPLSAPARFETTLASGRELRCVGIEFPTRIAEVPGGTPETSVVVVHGAQTARLEEKLAQGHLEVAITGLVSIAGISVVVLLALRRGGQLLGRVVNEVEGITPDSLAKPLEESRAPEEIRPIVTALNRSLRSLRGFVERERRFTADVAHELRTPIAELRAAADVALRWPDGDSQGRLGAHAQAISLQMGSLVESLLELSTLESEGDRQASEDVDLAKLVRQAAEQAGRAAGELRAIALDSPGVLTVASRAEHWEVAVRNLLDNARCYSPSGSTVSVRLRADADGAHLSVANPTDSIGPESIPRCTERLWRGKHANGEARHFGLGLSIVQAACAKLGHGFSVRLVDGVFHATISRTRQPVAFDPAEPGRIENGPEGDPHRRRIPQHP